MTTRVSLADAARIVADAGKPLLVFDTCSLLDIIRLPIRERSGSNAKNTLRAVQSILARAQADPPTIALAAPIIVLQEWQEHRERIESELTCHLGQTDTAFEVAAGISELFGSRVQPSRLGPMGIDRSLSNLSAGILTHCHILEMDTDAKSRAADRAASGQAPGAKGVIKDALIYEHTLELFTQLRRQGFQGKLAILTSNTKDFCGKDKVTPAEPIRTELSAVSASLVLNWQWALAELTG